MEPIMVELGILVPNISNSNNNNNNNNGNL